jgi:hypothetical protein
VRGDPPPRPRDRRARAGRPGKTVTFDWREDTTPLHEALGVDETDVRRSVLRLFQGVDEALLRHAEEVDRGWAALTRRPRSVRGGVAGHPGFQLAKQAVRVGMDPWRVLAPGDRVTKLVERALIEQARHRAR